MLSIVADENIPRVKEAFSSIGNVHLLDAESITPEVCAQADVLLVRSVTRIHEGLLKQSQVAFVGSATAGFDHVDRSYLRERGIPFVHAPGSNADSVVEYVLTALLRLHALRMRTLTGLILGIIGYGNIGGRLGTRAPSFGLQVLKHDPPLAKAGHPGFVDLKTVLTRSDILTLHVPKSPETHHLIGDAELRSMKPGAWVLNTSRGNVVDNQALKRALRTGGIDATVLDVWENEPVPDLELLQRVTLATPHIAGHSVDGKLQGTIMLYKAVTQHFQVPGDWDYEQLLQQNLPAPLSLNPEPESSWLGALAQQLYDIDADDARMRKTLHVPQDHIAETFRQLRRNYPPRRAFDRHTITEIPAPYVEAVRDGLRVGYL